MSAPMTERAVPTRVLAALLVLVVALGAGALWLGRDESSAAASATPTRPVLADSGGGTYRPGTLPGGGAGPVDAATRALPLTLAYDYRSLSADLDRATAHMTDSFAREFRRTFAGSAARLARSKQAVTSATVRSVGLVSLTGDKAVCLVYVDQALVSSATLRDSQAPVHVSQNRVLVGLVRDGGHWLVDSLSPI